MLFDIKVIICIIWTIFIFFVIYHIRSCFSFNNKVKNEPVDTLELAPKKLEYSDQKSKMSIEMSIKKNENIQNDIIFNQYDALEAKDVHSN